MIKEQKLAEWKCMAQWEECCVETKDSFTIYDIREMLEEIGRLYEFEVLAKETGIFP